MFKKSNLLFVILFISIFGFTGLLNYYTDPYDILHKDYKTLYCFNEKKELLKTIFYFSQKEKYEYLVVGSSTTNDFFNKNLLADKKTIFMTSKQFDFSSQVEYLEYILKIHPEIKTIIFPIEYAFFSINDESKTPKIKDDNLNIKDITTLLFSKESTLNSLKNLYNQIKKPKQIINNIKKTKDSKNQNNINEKESFSGSREISVFEKRNYYYSCTQPFLKQRYKSLEKLKNIIKDNDKKVIFFFPPYHALGQAFFYKTNKNNDIKEIKKYIVNNFPNAEIYDFAFVNNYTSEPLNQTKNYKDIMHPQGEPGYLYYCVLKHLNNFKDKQIYTKLTPNNVDKTIKWQEEKLKEYIKKNSENINIFMAYKQKDWEIPTKRIFNFPDNCNSYINDI